MSLFLRWVTVKCQRCNRTHCEVPPGTKVRFRCQRCKTMQIVEAN